MSRERVEEIKVITEKICEKREQLKKQAKEFQESPGPGAYNPNYEAVNEGNYKVAK